MTSNVNFSGIRKDMDAFENALESLDHTLWGEYFYGHRIFSNWPTNENVIYFNVGKIGKKHEI